MALPATAHHPRAASPVERASVAIILVVALLVRLPLLGRSFEQDELYTVAHSEGGPLWQTISDISAFNNHIGYSLAARLSAALLGQAEWAFRLPALLLGLASVYTCWIVSRYLLGVRCALLVTALLALSPAHIVWSVQARGYSGMMLFTLLSSYFYLRLLRCPTRRDATAFTVVSVLGLYCHLYAALVTLVQIVFLIPSAIRHWRQQPDQPTIASLHILGRSFVAIGALSLLCYAPALRSIAWTLKTRERSGVFLPSFPWAVLQEFSGTTWPILVALVLSLSVCGWLTLHRSRAQEVCYLTWLLLGPLLLAWMARPFDLYARFFAYYLPYYLMFFSAGLGSLLQLRGRRYLQRAPHVPGFIVATLLVVVFDWRGNVHTYMVDEGYREASRALQQHAGKDVAYCTLGSSPTIFQYYFARPLTVPRSLAEFRSLVRTYPEVRCIYYHNTWDRPGQAQIVQFLQHHSSSKRIKAMILFIYISPPGDRRLKAWSVGADTEIAANGRHRGTRV